MKCDIAFDLSFGLRNQSMSIICTKRNCFIMSMAALPIDGTDPISYYPSA